MFEITISRPGKEPETRVVASKTVTEEMRQLIRAGGTTGDVFRDFVIVEYGRIDHALECRYRALNARLSGKTGQLALVNYLVRPEVERISDGASSRPRTRFECGFLSEDSLAFRIAGERFPSCVVPMKRVALDGTIVSDTAGIDVSAALSNPQCRFLVGGEAELWLEHHRRKSAKHILKKLKT